MDSACGGSVLFVPPKYYRFKDPALEVRFDPEKGEITITSAAYARYVEIYSEDGYIRTDDNFFDMEAGTRTIKLLEGDDRNLKVRSVYDIR
jgi:beta-mannosidase